MRVYSRQELEERAYQLSTRQFCPSPADLTYRLLDRLLPRESVSTLNYSRNHRIIRKPDGEKVPWSLDLTPYLAPIMEDHDDPNVFEIIVPKPGRCGGTVVAENHALKLLDFNRNSDVMWYLAGPEEVRSYADRTLKPIMEDHVNIASRLPREGAKGNTGTLKRVGSQTLELMVMSAKTTTNRQAGYIVFDEPDSYNAKFASSFLEQGRQRQRMIGNDRKIYACAHPDIGWSGGIAAAWVLSSQGIFVMQCQNCGSHASPYPTKYWSEVPQFRLHYEKCPEGTPINERLAVAERTASIRCPHCNTDLDEIQRKAMIDTGAYMHKGQTLDVDIGIIGDADTNKTRGFWIHVLMSKQVALSELARELEGAIEHRERTGKTDKLRQVLIRTFGQVWEGAGELDGLNAQTLKARTKALTQDADGQSPVRFKLGEVPKGVRFITVAVDVGGNKFDIMARGWDTERRSWIIERRTIRQRLHSDGIMRDIAPSKVQDDWDVLIEEIDRLYPMQVDAEKALPVAVMTIDASDGNVTWKAYEFARRMDRKRWGSWQRVRCIKGATSPKAPHLSPTPSKISKDSEGKAVEPVVTLHMLGVHKLKEDTVDDLAISDGSPGQSYFATNFADRHYEELFNEVLIEGAWVRNGPNESLDLFGYTEAGRLMMEPDRKDRNWTPGKEPIWARPISLTSEEETKEPAKPTEPSKTNNVASAFAAMDRN